MVVETFKSSSGVFSLSFPFVLTQASRCRLRRSVRRVRRERLDAMRNERNERGRMDEIIAVKNYSQCFLV